jgi:thiol-disulfide isomerase/thioredoxin
LVVATIVWLRPSLPPPLRVGSEVPEFRLPVLDKAGPRSVGTQTLSELKGRVVFINFWATWCPPCRDESPSLERLYRRFGPRGLEVLAVSIDDPGALEAVSKFRDEFELTARRAYGAYQATGVPETFVISPEGRLVEQMVGPRDWDQPRYAALVERLAGSAAERSVLGSPELSSADPPAVAGGMPAGED